MGKTQFRDEIEDLVNKGYSSKVDFEIGSESFQHLRTIKRQIGFLKRLNIVLIILAFLLCAALAFIMLYSSEDSITANKPQDAVLSPVADESTVEKLKTENRLLKEKNASLQKDIKLIRKQFLARNSEQQSSNEVAQSKPQVDELVYHEVKNGETLYSIAEKYYGDKLMYKKIISDNGLSGTSDISEGKQLKIYREQ